MNGYVKNISPSWMHAFKRAIKPGGKIELDELHAQYGLKHDIPANEEFALWLRKVKLKDERKWEIKYLGEDENNESFAVEEEAQEPITENKEDVSPKVPTKEMTIADVVELSVRKARDILPDIRDLKLLKYALQEASARSGKDSLCRELRRRIKQIEIAR